ncbi:MAG: hypothetical protein E7388_04350 [Ruminococcaceae bacterium]|nr:hypothetical protein [Oscillospiraceae bacterium]
MSNKNQEKEMDTGKTTQEAIKIKKKKQKMLDSLAEGVVELILLIILFAVGSLVYLGISSIFSVETTDIDFDIIVLVGIISLVAIILIFALIKKFFKNKKE